MAMEQVRTINLEPGNKEEILPGFSEDFPYIATCAVSNGFSQKLTSLVGWSMTAPRFIKKGALQSNARFFYQYCVGLICQISSAYWRMVRSEENLAAEATFIRHLRPKARRSA